MSVFVYNNVTLPYPMTTTFDQQAVYDDSNTDYLYTKFDIKVQCLVNWNYMDQLAPDLMDNEHDPDSVKTENPADIMKLVRSLLMVPRKELSFKFNSVQLIPNKQEGNQGVVDAYNGPRPQSCSILQLNNTTFIVQYHIIAHYIEINPIFQGVDNITQQNAKGTNIVYNRWEDTLSLDETGFAKRVRNGKMRIRADNAKGQPAYLFVPQMCIVAPPPGNWLRKSSHYKLHPDGLAIEYGVEDLQVYRLPPIPAYKAEGTYYESSSVGALSQDINLKMGIPKINLGGNAQKDAQGNKISSWTDYLPTLPAAYRKVGVNLTLWGSPDVVQTDLLQMAIAVAVSKCTGTITQGGLQEGTDVPGLGVLVNIINTNTQDVARVLSDYSIAIDMYNNKVSVKMEAFTSNQLFSRRGSITIAPKACQIPGSDSGVPFEGAADDLLKNLVASKAITLNGKNEIILVPPNFTRLAIKDSVLLQAANYWDPSTLKLDDIEYIGPTDPKAPKVGQAAIDQIILPGYTQLSAGDQPGTLGK